MEEADSELTIIRELIVECDRCELRAGCTAPVPFSGDYGNSITVLGEAPGKEEDAEGRPFIGQAGQLIREMFIDVGLNPDSCNWMNTASCFPHGTPTAEHIEACAVNRELQYEALDPIIVLVLGNVALSTFRPDLKIGSVHGRVFMPYGRSFWCYATYHPAAALRSGTYDRTLRKDLAQFMEVLEEGDPSAFLAETCAACPSPASWYDEDRFGWCLSHLPEAGRQRQRMLQEEYRRACERLSVGTGAAPADWDADQAAERISADAAVTQASLDWPSDDDGE